MTSREIEMLNLIVKKVGGKWKMLIIATLLNGEMRFNELRRSVRNITQRSLVIQLNELLNQQLIEKRPVEDGSDIYVYALTELGKSLQDVINSMLGWIKSRTSFVHTK